MPVQAQNISLSLSLPPPPHPIFTFFLAAINFPTFTYRKLNEYRALPPPLSHFFGARKNVKIRILTLKLKLQVYGG